MILLKQKLKNLMLQKMNRFKYWFVGALFLHLLTIWFDTGSNYCMAIAPLLLGTLAAAGGAAMNDIANQVNKSNARYSMDLQKELMDYEWKNFNSPQAQMSSLAKAGINPAVAFGQGAVRGISPSMGAPSLAQSDIGLSGQDMASTILALSEAKKAGSEAAGQDLNNVVTKSALNELIKAPALANKYTAEQTANLTQQIGLMSAQFQEIQQKIENSKAEQKLTEEQTKWFGKEMQAKIDDLRASKQYKEAVSGLTDSQKELLDKTMEDLVSITGFQKDIQQTTVNLLNRYGDAQAVVGLLSQVVGSASDLIGSIASFKNINKVVESVTGSTTQNSDGSWTTTNTKTTRR